MSEVKTKTRKRLQRKTVQREIAGKENGRSPRVSPTNGHMGPFYAAGPAVNLMRTVQTKLVVGRPNDPYEQEADAVADQVTNGGPETSISAVQPGSLNETEQAKTEEEEPVQSQAEDETVQSMEEGEPVQTKSEDEPVQSMSEEEPVQSQSSEEEPVQAATEEEPVQSQSSEEEPVQAQSEEEPVQAQSEEEPVQSKDGRTTGPQVSAETAATIRNPGPGQPMAANVRQQIEPNLGSDLSGVRVHSGSRAQRAADNLGARAFTHGSNIFLNRNESVGDVRLMAHESTHVVQQGAAAVRRQPMPEVQMLPGVIMDRIASYARHIPGYTLFTVIIGVNPLTGARVERNAMNLLEGLMGLVPFGTAIFDKLQEYGILQEAFTWVNGQLNRLDLSVNRIERTLEAAWEDVSLARGFDYNLAVLRRHFGRLKDDVVSFVRTLIDHIIELIKEAAINVAEGLLAENKAYALIKKIIKYDPLRDETVEATTVEILEDFLMLIGKQQELEEMRKRGTLQETADWLDTQFATFMGLLSQLRSLFTAAWNAIQPENLPRLPENLQKLAADVGSFLQQVWDFATTVALKVLELVKKALLSWLSSFAHEVPGFHLVTVLLGRNPFTNETVPRTAENIIKGFITLLPGGEEKFRQMQETGTIPQAAQRIEGAMAELGITWDFIVGLFTEIWDSVSINDLIDPIGAFQRIVDRFGEPIARLFRFIRIVVEEIIKLILELMNFPTDIIARIISNAMQAFEDIKNDPIGFLKNMLEAVKLGFTHFFDNILQHLLSGLTEWFFAQLRKAGIEPPSEITLESALDLVLQILGISMDRIWEKLAEKIGQENVDRIRGAIDKLVGIWNFIKDVQERGIAAIWEYIESQISGLWDMVLEQARNWIVTKVIEKVVTKLLSMLDPTGIMAVVNSFIAFFNAVQSAIEYIREILLIIDDYVSTIAAVARGDIAPGAAKMEQGLANAIPVAIGFLANQVGLGNLAEHIATIVGRIRAFVDKALDWLIDRAVSMVQSVLRAIGVGGTEEEQPQPDVANMTPDQRKQAAKQEIEQALASGIPGNQLHQKLNEVKTRYALRDVQVDRSNAERPKIKYFASDPEETIVTQAQAPPATPGSGGTSRLTPSGFQTLRTPYGAVKDRYGDDTIASSFALTDENWVRPATVRATVVGPRPGGSRTSVIGKSGHVGKDEHFLAVGTRQSYHGGHLIGLQLIGTDTNVPENLAPQIGSFNSGTYLQIENLVKNSPINTAGDQDPQTPVELEVQVSYPGSDHNVPFARLQQIGAIRSSSADKGSVTIPRRVPNRWRMNIKVQNSGFSLSQTTPSGGTQMASQARGTAPETSTFIQPSDRFVWFRIGAAPNPTATTIGGNQEETIIGEQATP